VDGPRGALGAYLMMKRGCRVGLVSLPSGEELARRVLARFDPAAHVESAAADRATWAPAVARLAEESRADGVVLPIEIGEFPEARGLWGERVLFSPTVGLTDGEVDAWWKSVASLAA
jgi:hypothetical protein